MALYGEVSQLLSLMQWGARAHAYVAAAMIELRLLPVTEWLPARTPDSPQAGQDSWLTDCELD
jgi:hypothetical protein